ncbi:MAG: TIGR02147 family protein [Chitinivibrionales bacterium]|nr:TIGR02147 family protein [Chitinivibrionales bacterium]
MKKPFTTITIRDYLDYRAFLRDCYKDIHFRNKKFNYQYLIAATGLKSPGHITQIFNGNRNIAQNMIEPFAKAFKLKKSDTEYFRNLVYYNQAKKHTDKDRFFQKLVAYHRKDKKLIDPEVYKYFSAWYNPVVRELVEVFLVSDDTIKECAKLLQPRISTKQMNESLGLLMELGLITKSENGIYRRCGSVISTGEAWHSITIHNYQRETMDLAKGSLDTVPKEDRDISTVTLSVAERQFLRIRARLKELRKELLDIAKDETTPDRIYQCNIQFFPVIDRLNSEQTDE